MMSTNAVRSNIWGIAKWTGAVAVALTLAGAANAETVEEAISRIATAEDSLTSAYFKTTVKSDSEMANMDSVMETWMKKEGEEKKTRIESKTSMEIKGAGQKMDQSSIVVMNGDTMWTESTQNGMTQVMKGEAVDTSIKSTLTNLTAQGTEVTLAGTETVNGESCTVFAMNVAQPGAPGTGLDMKMWISNESGVMMKSVMDSPAMGKVTMEAVEVKKNIAIDESRFDYTPPEGVEVMDMSQMMGGAQPMP